MFSNPFTERRKKKEEDIKERYYQLQAQQQQQQAFCNPTLSMSQPMPAADLMLDASDDSKEHG